MQELKVIVAGGRDFNDYQQLSDVLFDYAENQGDVAISLVSGMARGADALAYQFAQEHNVQCYAMPADWNTYGKAAGFRRNSDMAAAADALIAFWDGKSRGTDHMIQTMKKLNKPVTIIRY